MEPKLGKFILLCIKRKIIIEEDAKYKHSYCYIENLEKHKNILSLAVSLYRVSKRSEGLIKTTVASVISLLAGTFIIIVTVLKSFTNLCSDKS